MNLDRFTHLLPAFHRGFDNEQSKEFILSVLENDHKEIERVRTELSEYMYFPERLTPSQKVEYLIESLKGE